MTEAKCFMKYTKEKKAGWAGNSENPCSTD